MKPQLSHITANLEFPICGIPVELPVDMEYVYEAAEAPSFDSPGSATTVEIASARIHGEPLLDRFNSDQIESLKLQVLEHEGVREEYVASEPPYQYDRQAHLRQVREEALAGDLVTNARRAG